jgi:hypothetical protein
MARKVIFCTPFFPKYSLMISVAMNTKGQMIAPAVRLKSNLKSENKEI